MKSLHRHFPSVSFTVGLLVFAGFCIFAGIEASGAPEPSPELHRAVSPRRAEVEESRADAVNPAVESLAAYTLSVMNDWPPSIIAHADYGKIAHDIAAASLERPSSEPPADAVLLAALGYFEGARYASYVESWECNDPEWRKTGFDTGPLHHPRERGVLAPETSVWLSSELMHVGGDCDGGRAHGIFQLWYAVDPSAPLYVFCSKDALEGGQNGQAEARCALEIARTDSSLCGYAGERASEGCPKGEVRRKFALEALARHPFLK